MAPAKKSTSTKKSTGRKPATKSLAKTVAEKKKTARNVVSKKKGDQRAAVKKATTGKDTIKKSTKSESTPKKAAAKKKPASDKAPKKNSVFRCPLSGMPVKSEKPNISPKTLSKLKDLLVEEKVKHVQQVEDLIRDADELIADREGGDTVFDEESGEGDTLSVERERSLYLAKETQHTVTQIDAALEKIEKGTYGVCGPSSRRISVDRLNAIPWTDVCFDCKMRSERRL
jgi:RNA polymerase-binding transcription factor DksA